MWVFGGTEASSSYGSVSIFFVFMLSRFMLLCSWLYTRCLGTDHSRFRWSFLVGLESTKSFCKCCCYGSFQAMFLISSSQQFSRCMSRSKWKLCSAHGRYSGLSTVAVMLWVAGEVIFCCIYLRLMSCVLANKERAVTVGSTLLYYIVTVYVIFKTTWVATV